MLMSELLYGSPYNRVFVCSVRDVITYKEDLFSPFPLTTYFFQDLITSISLVGRHSKLITEMMDEEILAS
jgi:hypothetical protein